jgi:hypothetical protein
VKIGNKVTFLKDNAFRSKVIKEISEVVTVKFQDFLIIGGVLKKLIKE